MKNKSSFNGLNFSQIDKQLAIILRKIPNYVKHIFAWVYRLKLSNSWLSFYQKFTLLNLLGLVFLTTVLHVIGSSAQISHNISNNTSNNITNIGDKISYKNSGLVYKTSWLGNTIGRGKLRVQNNVEGMYVVPDGTIYTNSHWDEAGAESSIYKDGKPIASLEDTHGWNRGGGQAIAVDQNYIYLGMVQDGMDDIQHDYPPVHTTWYCVRRYNLAGKPAPFSGGRGWDKSMLITSDRHEITGLAIAEHNLKSRLYVSQAQANQVLIYDPSTMEQIGSFKLNHPQAIAVDRQGNLWIIQGKTAGMSPRISHYSPEGVKFPQEITDVVEPTAIAIDSQGRLLIAEDGPHQQILIYDVNNRPIQVGTFGQDKGIYGGVPGEVQDLKLYGLTGIGTDTKGNIYLNNSFHRFGTNLSKFSPTGQLQWRLLGLLFVDNADTDPKSDGKEIFTKLGEFSLDYSQPLGSQWKYKAYTLNSFKYPQDPRLHTSPNATFFRRIQGRPILFLTDMYNSFLQIYRFNPNTDGKIAIPSGMFVGSKAEAGKSLSGNWPPYQPLAGEWIWRDNNGNGAFDPNEYDVSHDYPYMGGWWVDNKGDVWKALRTQDGIGIRHYPLDGFDVSGNPIYKYSSMQKQRTPDIFSDLHRIEYFPETDIMYLSGFTTKHPAIGDQANIVGSEIARFDHWSQGNRTPRWRTMIPYDPTAKSEVMTAAMSVAGEYVFAVTVKTAEVYVYQAATGKLVQKLKPGPEVGNQSGWVDIPYGIRAFRRKDGEYLVFAEEDLQGKVIIYQLPKS